MVPGQLKPYGQAGLFGAADGPGPAPHLRGQGAPILQKAQVAQLLQILRHSGQAHLQFKRNCLLGQRAFFVEQAVNPAAVHLFDLYPAQITFRHPATSPGARRALLFGISLS